MYVINGWRELLDGKTGERYFVCDSCFTLEGEGHTSDCELIAFLKPSL